jgi:hypothetical protein
MLLAALVGVASSPITAESATNGAGVVMKPLYPGDTNCFSVNSYSGIVNSCASARWISTTLPVPGGWHTTNVSVYGNNTMCHTISTNGVGNGANLGADTWTLAGPKTWQTLATGDRFVWDWSPVLFECLLESGGVIGSFTAL